MLKEWQIRMLAFWVVGPICAVLFCVVYRPLGVLGLFLSIPAYHLIKRSSERVAREVEARRVMEKRTARRERKSKARRP